MDQNLSLLIRPCSCFLTPPAVCLTAQTLCRLLVCLPTPAPTSTSPLSSRASSGSPWVQFEVLLLTRQALHNQACSHLVELHHTPTCSPRCSEANSAPNLGRPSIYLHLSPPPKPHDVQYAVFSSSLSVFFYLLIIHWL